MKEALNLTLACSTTGGSGIPIIVEQATQNPRSWVYIIIYNTLWQTIWIVRFLCIESCINTTWASIVAMFRLWLKFSRFQRVRNKAHDWRFSKNRDKCGAKLYRLRSPNELGYLQMSGQKYEIKMKLPNIFATFFIPTLFFPTSYNNTPTPRDLPPSHWQLRLHPIR